MMGNQTNAAALKKCHVPKVKVLAAAIPNVKEGLYANPTVDLLQITRKRVAVALIMECTYGQITVPTDAASLANPINHANHHPVH